MAPIGRESSKAAMLASRINAPKLFSGYNVVFEKFERVSCVLEDSIHAILKNMENRFIRVYAVQYLALQCSSSTIPSKSVDKR